MGQLKVSGFSVPRFRFALDGIYDRCQLSRRPKNGRSDRKETRLESNKIMAIYEILIVGAASIRDYAMIAKKRLFFAAESRSHYQLMQFDDLATRLIELSHERCLVWP